MYYFLFVHEFKRLLYVLQFKAQSLNMNFLLMPDSFTSLRYYKYKSEVSLLVGEHPEGAVQNDRGDQEPD